MSLIRSEEVEYQKQILKNYILSLKQDIEIFNEKTKEVQELIDVLKVVYNTAGGINKLKQISEIEFDQTKLYQIGDMMETINVIATKEPLNIKISELIDMN